MIFSLHFTHSLWDFSETFFTNLFLLFRETDQVTNLTQNRIEDDLKSRLVKLAVHERVKQLERMSMLFNREKVGKESGKLPMEILESRVHSLGAPHATDWMLKREKKKSLYKYLIPTNSWKMFFYLLRNNNSNKNRSQLELVVCKKKNKWIFYSS